MYLIKRGKYFYPRPPRGGRPAWVGFAATSSRFLSTPSARRATDDSANGDSCPLHFYPRPPRGGRRVESKSKMAKTYFYPRPPRGGRPVYRTLYEKYEQFLSTPSARRATLTHRDRLARVDISIHALREEGDSPWLETAPAWRNFYPRPPRGGRPWHCR